MCTASILPPRYLNFFEPDRVHNETWTEASATHLFKTFFFLVAAHLLLLMAHSRSLSQSTLDTPPDEIDEFPQRLGLRDS